MNKNIIVLLLLSMLSNNFLLSMDNNNVSKKRKIDDTNNVINKNVKQIKLEDFSDEFKKEVWAAVQNLNFDKIKQLVDQYGSSIIDLLNQRMFLYQEFKKNEWTTETYKGIL